MSANDDVHGAIGKPGARVVGLLGGDEPGEPPDLEWKGAEALGEPRIVLAGEQGGGGNHGDLLPCHGRNESGTQRDLGLAETNIAADQSVHRLARG